MSLGLATYRWNNNIKSMLLLAALPLLLLGLMGGFFLAVGFFGLNEKGRIDIAMIQNLGLMNTQIVSPLDLAKAGIIEYWPIMIGVSAIWMIIGYFFNGMMINMATGAKPVSRVDAPELYNTLENLCISRGLKMPRLCIIEGAGMNAYASGLGENSYSVTVTRGLLERLNKEELEAVLAHEMTHIQNRDVRLLIITIVFTGMLSFFAQMMWRSLRFASYGRNDDRDKKGGGTFIIMIIAGVTLVIGYLLALLLRFALSRKREYLADAGSVELTKNPAALISALEKISGNADIPHVPPEVQQMFIENPPSIFGLFDTHPPIAKRVEVLRQLGGLPPEGESIIPKAGRF